jgi:ubiquinone/menaquinone biosynthesis C-methylase UbiE
MNPYYYVREATKNGESLLSLCCGIGLELHGLNTTDITGVDICKPYLDHMPHTNVKKVLMDAKSYILQAPDKSVDVISFIDGLEHIDKEDGKIILEECKRVARKHVLVFTQIGYLRNEPVNAWGIEGGDIYQRHVSGWEVSEVEAFGYKLIAQSNDISQHNEPYTAVMYEWRV